MRNLFQRRLGAIVCAAAGLVCIDSARAVQYPNIDPGYNQQIYTGPLVGGPGMAWTPGGNLLTRNGSQILEYSPTQNAVHQGTSIHGTIATHNVPGLLTTGYGMVNAVDGYVYTVTGAGLQRFDPTNFAAPAQTLAGTVGGQGYGITCLPDGRIAYSDGTANSNVYLYDPSNGNNSLIYSTNFTIDDIEAGPTGAIALAGQSNSAIHIITPAGGLINSFATPHFPDGLAFGDGAFSNSLFSNNNDGTISRYDLAPGYLGIPAIVDIATGSQAYGDLAQVGPDCAFYVSQFDNFGLHGSTPGIGTHWDNGVTNNEPSIIRIAALDRLSGAETCEFWSVFHVPEPSSLMLVGMALLPMISRRRRS